MAAPQPSSPARTASPSPLRRRRWRRLIIAFIAAAVIDLGLQAAQATNLLQRLDALHASVEYGLSSVNAVRFVGDISRRLGDRRHISVWSWRAPFNLTEVCRDGRGPDFGESVAALCVTESRAKLAPGTPPALMPYLPLRELGSVDRDRYPRRAWFEIPLGLPDGVLFAVRCAWNGQATCAADTGSVSPTRNWVGHLMLAAIVLLAVWASAPGRVANRKAGWSPIAFGLAFVGGLVVASVLAFVGLLALKGLMWLSWGVLRLSSAVAGLAAFRPVLWMASAVKDIATDRAANVLSAPLPPRT